MDPSRQTELERAINARDHAAVERILVEEAERDPKSPRSAKLLAIAAAVFFLDGHYVNAVIAWKKAEAIAPLDDRSRFTLAMACIRLNRRDWARPELEKLAAAQSQNPQKHASSLSYLHLLAYRVATGATPPILLPVANLEGDASR